MLTTALNRITRRLPAAVWLPAATLIVMAAPTILPLVLGLMGTCPVDGSSGC